jgi:hypothetical protein
MAYNIGFFTKTDTASRGNLRHSRLRFPLNSPDSLTAHMRMHRFTKSSPTSSVSAPLGNARARRQIPLRELRRPQLLDGLLQPLQERR